MTNDLYIRYCKQEEELGMLRQNVAELQEQLQRALIRISELREQLNRDRSIS